MDRRRQFWTALALTLLAFGLRLNGLGYQSLWRDEVDAIRFAAEPVRDTLLNFLVPGQNGSLYFLVLRPWLRLTGESEFALRAFSALLGVLAVPLCYRLAQTLFPDSPRHSLAAAMLMATSPYLVWYSQEGKMYALCVVLVLLSMELCVGALEHGGWRRWLAYSAVTGLAPYVHFVLALLIPAQFGVLLASKRWRSPLRPVFWLACMGLLLFLSSPLLRWQLPMLFDPAETGFQFVSLPEMVASLIRAFTLGVVPGLPTWLLVPWSLVLLALLAFHRTTDGPNAMTVLTLWLVIPVVGLFLVSLSRPLITARYLILVLPALVLLWAAGYASAAKRSRLGAAILLVVCLCTSAWGLRVQATTALKADFRSATEYLLPQMAEGELVIFQIPYGRFSFEYYARVLTARATPPRSLSPYHVYLPVVQGGHGWGSRYFDGLYTNAGMDPAEVAARMSAAVAGRRVVWLVATETELWDRRGLVQSWLNEHGELGQVALFTRVTVYRYEFPKRDGG